MRILLMLLTALPALAQRPPSSLSLPSARGFPLLVHGPTGSMPLLGRIRDAADRSWQAEMIDGGWAAPADDGDGNFDFYIDETLALGEAYTIDDGGSGSSLPSYIGLPGEFIDDDDLFSIVAHELNHASQYALNALEDDAFFEHTAVFVERRVAQHFPTWSVGLADYQAHPERALDYLVDDYYEYGAAAWLMFLSERYDGGGQKLVQRLWSGGFLATLDKILNEKGISRGRFFAELAVWRWFTGTRDDGKHFAGAAEWPMVAMNDAPLGAFGARYSFADGPFEARLTGDGAAAALVPLDGGEPIFVEAGSAKAGKGKYLLALVWAPSAYDPATGDGRTGDVAIAVVPVVDSGGCAVGGRPSGAWILLVLLVLGRRIKVAWS